MKRNTVLSHLKLLRFFILMISFLLLFHCESLEEVQRSDLESEVESSQSHLQRIANLSKSALVLKIFSIIQADPKSSKVNLTTLPNTKSYLRNLQTNEIIESDYHYEGLNLFLDISPGEYQIYQLKYDDVLSFPIVSSLFPTLDDKTIPLEIIQLKDVKHPLYIHVPARKYLYAGDITVILTENGVSYSPPIQENKDKDMREASELIISKYPHSKWAKKALDYLGIK